MKPTTKDVVQWCYSHNREATSVNEKGVPCCDPSLGGILLPCRAITSSPDQLGESRKQQRDNETVPKKGTQ